MIITIQNNELSMIMNRSGTLHEIVVQAIARLLKCAYITCTILSPIIIMLLSSA